MTAIEIFQSGNLQEAIQALGEEVRNNPLDTKRRIFLFELLCFAGQFERAEKHLNILADASPSAAAGTLLYRSAIHAEKTRQQMFMECAYPAIRDHAETSCIQDQTCFSAFADADPRIGASLEVFVAGSYTWVALEQIASIEVPKPKRLRDLLWTPAFITAAAAYQSLELGEVLLPVLSPLSWKHHYDSVRLGRCTVWEEDPAWGEIPFGQKMFRLDEQEIPILELGKIQLSSVGGESRAATA